MPRRDGQMLNVAALHARDLLPDVIQAVRRRGPTVCYLHDVLQIGIVLLLVGERA